MLRTYADNQEIAENARKAPAKAKQTCRLGLHLLSGWLDLKVRACRHVFKENARQMPLRHRAGVA